MILFIYYPLTAYDIQYQVTSSDQSATRLRNRETLHIKHKSFMESIESYFM